MGRVKARRLAPTAVAIVYPQDAGTLARIDPATRRIVDRVDIGVGARLVLAGRDALYVAQFRDDRVLRVDTRTLAVRRSPRVCTGPQGMAEAGGSVWVACTFSDEVVALDQLPEQLVFADVVVASTASPHPIVDVEELTLFGYEALTRFDDGTPPDVMFKLAHSCKLGLDLEAATLGAAIDNAVLLQPTAALSLNVSVGMLLDSRLHPLLEATGDRLVMLELTEHERVDDYCATAFVACHEPQPVPRLDLAAALADIGRLPHEQPLPLEPFFS